MVLMHEGEDVRGDGGADAVDTDQLGPGVAVAVLRRFHGVAPGVESAIGARQQPSRRLADLADAERINEPLQRHRPAHRDGADQVRRRLFAPAFAPGDLCLAITQPENVAR